jgi:hypothetical protein
MFAQQATNGTLGQVFALPNAPGKPQARSIRGAQSQLAACGTDTRGGRGVVYDRTGLPCVTDLVTQFAYRYFVGAMSLRRNPPRLSSRGGDLSNRGLCRAALFIEPCCASPAGHIIQLAGIL